MIVCVLIIARAGVAVFKVIIMTAIRIAVKRPMTINVAIANIVANAVVTVVMSAIVSRSRFKKVTTVVVVGRIADTIIIGVIGIISTISIIIMTAISMTVTSVCARFVNRKKKLGRRAAIRTTAPSRGATSPVDFSRRANVWSEPVAPAQKAARDDDSMRFLMSEESHTVLQRCADVLPEGGPVELRASETICNHPAMSFENWTAHEFCQATAIADNHQVGPSAGAGLWLAS